MTGIGFTCTGTTRVRATRGPAAPRPHGPAEVAQIDDATLSDLLGRVAAGDRAAFRAIYDAQGALMYAVAMRICRQSALASDAVHDALLQVWRSSGWFDAGRGNPNAWLMSLVRYRALDIARRRGRETSDEDMPELADSDPDPLDRLQTAREAAALHGCLGRLPADRRQLVALAFVEGLSHSEVADRLSLPLGTVKSWIRRSLIALRGCLEETG